MINLGEKIKLEGFEGINPIQLIVVKKMVGIFAKKSPEKELEVKLASNSSEFVISARFGDKQAEEKDSNLFVALGSVLKKLE